MNTHKQKNALVLFAKAPIAGNVKTRLQPQITPVNSALLQEALIKDTINKMISKNNLDKFVYFWPAEQKNMFENFIGGLPIQLCCQSGKNLGEKMAQAFQDLFDKRFHKVVIIGTDSPTLPAKYIIKAFEKLNKSEIVIGPSADGGYYLIGLKEKVCPVFSSVDWGTSKVLSQTEKLIKENNVSLSLLPVHYDIDTIDNLYFLKTHLRLLSHSGEELPVYTERILGKIF